MFRVIFFLFSFFKLSNNDMVKLYDAKIKIIRINLVWFCVISDMSVSRIAIIIIAAEIIRFMLAVSLIISEINVFFVSSFMII